MFNIDDPLDALVARNAAMLTTEEIMWRDKQPFLESRGYMLRPRLRPGWVPSWMTGQPVDELEFCEDFLCLPVCDVLVSSLSGHHSQLLVKARGRGRNSHFGRPPCLHQKNGNGW